VVPTTDDDMTTDDDPAVRRAAAIAFVMELAEALHRHGTPAHRLETAMAAVTRQLGFDAQFLTTPTFILAGFGPTAGQQTSLVRVEPGGVDLERLAALDRIADRVGAGELSVADGVARVRALAAAPRRYPVVVRVAASALLSACIARFFGGGLAEVGVAAVIGLVVGLLSLGAGRTVAGARVLDLVAAFCAAALAHGASVLGLDVSVRIATLAGVIALVPGLTMTVAMTEVATRHLVAGTARLMAAAIVFLQITVGVALADQVMNRLVGPAVAAAVVPLPTWTELAALPLVALALLVDLRGHPRQLLAILVASFAAFYAARFGAVLLDPHLGAVVGSFVIGAGANVYARLVHRPAMVPLVPGLILLVPGSMGLRSLSSLLERDVVTGIDTAFAMVLIAVSLVAGLLLANATVPPRREL
jgi:uncharacterized membrane protein YjjP (DUF1212 family)